jgi:branched-chain amino acid transport system permease protein
MLQLFGPHTLIGLSAYLVILTGQISLAQAGFYAVGAFGAGMATVMWNVPVVPALLIGAVVAGLLAALVGLPALRVRGLMLVVATLVFTQLVQIFFFNFTFQVERDGEKVGPIMGEGLRQIRYFNAHGWTPIQVTLLVWSLVALVMAALWWVDHSRLGAVLRAVGENEVAAQSAGINLTAVKVFAVGVSGFIAGLGGGLHAHLTTHIEQSHFGILLAVLAISYPLIGGTGTVFGTLLGVVFIQGLLIEGLRFLGDWRNILFGALIIAVTNFLPFGLLNPRLSRRLHRRFLMRTRSHA